MKAHVEFIFQSWGHDSDDEPYDRGDSRQWDVDADELESLLLKAKGATPVQGYMASCEPYRVEVSWGESRKQELARVHEKIEMARYTAEKAAGICEAMVVGGRAWTHDQEVAADALFAAAKAIRALASALPGEPSEPYDLERDRHGHRV